MNVFHEEYARGWVSQPVHIQKCFDAFEGIFPDALRNKKFNKHNYDAKIILSAMGEDLPTEQMHDLITYCAEDKYNVPDEPAPLYAKSVEGRQKLFERESIPPPSVCNLATLNALRKCEDEFCENPKYKNTVWIHNSIRNPKNPDRDPRRDLEPYQDLIIHIKVYEPLRKYEGGKFLPRPSSYELSFLGNHTLADLRDKIKCPADLCREGDMSLCRDIKKQRRAKDVFTSGFIYIEGVFYNDFRTNKSWDYSEGIRKWADRKNIGHFETALMEKTLLIDLKPRLGFPYVYLHQGKCEHLIIFSDIRLLNGSDYPSSLLYPSFVTIPAKKSNLCMICSTYTARWITFDSDRVPVDPFYFCNQCFRSYNYKDGLKIGNFKAYEFLQGSAIM